MKKRWIAMLLVWVMLFSTLPISATNVTAQTDAVIAVDEVWATAGSTVDVRIAITGNPGILGATLTVSWGEGLTLIGDKTGDAFAGTTYQKPSRYVNTGTNFMWYGSDLEKVSDGTVLTLTFAVSETAQGETSVPVSISCSGVYDSDQNAVNVSTVSGFVRVLNYMPGDVSENDVIDALDLIMLARYISDGCTTDPDGYNITLAEGAADVNADGVMDALDLIMISRYISDGCETDPEGYNVTLRPSTFNCAHTLTAVDAKAATCTESGTAPYWKCTQCNKLFTDQTAQEELSSIPTVSPIGHNYVGTPTWEWTDDYQATAVFTCVNNSMHKDRVLATVTSTTTQSTCTVDGVITYRARVTYSDIMHEILTTQVLDAKGHTPVDDPAVVATCTTAGKTAGNHCSVCNAVIVKQNDIPAFGHQYANGTDGQCLNCTIVKYPAPTISSIEYDEIIWNSVGEEDTEYTVIVNNNYTWVGKGTNCSLSEVVFNGEKIMTPGTVTVKVQANGDDEHLASDRSPERSYYYVPRTQVSVRSEIGKGYNLVETPYLYGEDIGIQSVLDTQKLATMGRYENMPYNNEKLQYYRYSSINECVSKTSEEYHMGAGVDYGPIASLRLDFELNNSSDYHSYQYYETVVLREGRIDKDYYFADLTMDEIKYCMSDEFVRDIREILDDLKQLESVYANDPVMLAQKQEETLQVRLGNVYTVYGTHAILGVVTGGAYTARYTVFTDEVSIAQEFRSKFDAKANGVINLMKMNFDVNVNFEGTAGSSNKTTKITFNADIDGGTGGACTSLENIDDAIARWSASFAAPDSATAIAFSDKNGAVTISELIKFIDVDLGNKYEAYVDSRVGDAFNELYEKYSKPIDNPIDSMNGNTLTIDLSAYQRSGEVSDAASGNLMSGVYTVYPKMYGKDVQNIKIIGGFNQSKTLIDNFSIALVGTWNRAVTIEFSDVGFAGVNLNGIVDNSKMKNGILNPLVYTDGTINIFERTDGTAEVHSGDRHFLVGCDPSANESLDYSTAKYQNGSLYLPIVSKPAYRFVEWFDDSGNVVTDNYGKVLSIYQSPEGVTMPVLTQVSVLHMSTVTLDANGGSLPMDANAYFYIDVNGNAYADLAGTDSLVDVALVTPTRIGYRFAGYYVYPDGDQNQKKQYVDANGYITDTCRNAVWDQENITLHAEWEKVAMRVVSRENMDEPLFYIMFQDATHAYQDEAATIPLTTISIPTMAGYHFGGYADAFGTIVVSGDGTIILDALDVNKYRETIVLTTTWSDRVVWEVTLDEDGASTHGTSKYYVHQEVDVYKESTCTTTFDKITRPGKIGYKFDGYYLNDKQYIAADGTINLDFSKSLTAHTTLKANWIPEIYEIQLDFGSSGDINPGTAVCYLKYGDGFFADRACTSTLNSSNRISLPSRYGYLFEGYYVAVYDNKTPNAYGENYCIQTNGEILVSSKSFTSNTTLYAIWRPVAYTVTLDATGGDCWTNSVIVYHNSRYGEFESLPTPTRNGYRFDGWYTADGVRVENDSDIKYESDHTLVARWTGETYEVTFDFQGGFWEDTANNQCVDIGTKLTVVYGVATYIPNYKMVKSGYKFKGWAVVPAGGIMYRAGANLSNITSSITLYAVWE